MNNVIMMVMIMICKATQIYVSLDRRALRIIPGRDLILTKQRRQTPAAPIGSHIPDTTINPLLHNDHLKQSQQAYTKESTNNKSADKPRKSSKGENQSELPWFLIGGVVFMILFYGGGTWYERYRKRNRRMTNLEVLQFVMANRGWGIDLDERTGRAILRRL